MDHCYSPRNFLRDRTLVRRANDIGAGYQKETRRMKDALIEYGYESLRGNNSLRESQHTAQINAVFLRLITDARKNVREYVQWLMDRSSQHALGWETLLDLERALDCKNQDTIDAEDERFAIVTENTDEQDELIQCYTLIKNHYR